MQFEYVFSATGFFGFGRSIWVPHVVEAMKDAYKLLNKKTKKIMIGEHHFTVGHLYNAFCEESILNNMIKMDLNKYFDVYADSGGLQMVTRDIDPSTYDKSKIYENQSYATFATCFDEIPLKRLGSFGDKTERVFVGNKIFDPNDIEVKARLTGKNIKEQIRYFLDNDKKTKVLAIVQGNSSNDMYDFYNYMMDELSDEEIQRGIGGICLADTCIGNGILETVEMVKAARLIEKVSPESCLRRLHFLGIGSKNRIQPALNLSHSNFISKYESMSIDSSTHSMMYCNGRYINEDYVLTSLGQYKSEKVIGFFQQVYDYFLPFFKKYDIDFDFILDNAFEGNEWPVSGLFRNTFGDGKTEKQNIAGVSWLFLYTAYNMLRFIQNLKDEYENYSNDRKGQDFLKHDAIEKLKYVRDDNDMLTWEGDYARYVSSKRITRLQTSNLEDFF